MVNSSASSVVSGGKYESFSAIVSFIGSPVLTSLLWPVQLGLPNTITAL
jgi:hypothetical protein